MGWFLEEKIGNGDNDDEDADSKSWWNLKVKKRILKMTFKIRATTGESANQRRKQARTHVRATVKR